MSLGERFAMVCSGIIPNRSQADELLGKLDQSGRMIIETDISQMAAFCCNVLEVKNSNKDPFILLSDTALNALTTQQQKKLESVATLLPVHIPTIEKVGGGSIRCMVAEVFLPEKSQINSFTITTTKKASDLEKIFSLRWQVLRELWNQPQGSERDDQEEQAIHFMATENNGQVIGTGRLQFNSPSQGQIRFMAVDPQYQGKGVGKKLVLAMEEEAKRNGISKIVLHAREFAVPFYESMQYKVTEQSYLLFGSVQHFLMEKKIDN